jgi:hypothetical protein
MKARGVISGFFLAGVVFGMPQVAGATGPEAIATAAQHAGLSANSGDLGMIARHLHHALNCLVGPDGEGFDEAAGNPCGGTGAAIPQTSDAEQNEVLVELAAEIREVFTESSGDAAALKEIAAEVQESLQDD